MTLKTLNDLCYGDTNPDISAGRADLIKESREAAKEWITHLWGEVGRVMTLGTRENVIPLKEVEKLNVQIDWINMFFNLEVEDK